MDPVRSIFNLDSVKRHVIIDSDRVCQEEFEAAAVISDVIWGHEGLAEMLGSTWHMVHDPRFLAMERFGVWQVPGRFTGMVNVGQQTIKAGDFFNTGGTIDEMTIYVELLGEGRHFLKVVTEKGWDPKAQLTEEQVMELLESECKNYKRRDGSWNRDAIRLKNLLLSGLTSLVYDYADVAYCTDWVRMDTQEVVEPGKRLMVQDEDGVEVEDDVPVIAVEVDNLFKALTMRTQVRITAYKLVKNFPGIKAEELDNLQLTDEESDEICKLLFSVKWDKVYTVIPKVAAYLKSAGSRTLDERHATMTTRLVATSREFNEKLKTGEIPQIKTEVAPATENDTTTFFFKLQSNPYYAGLFSNLQIWEARGDEEAKALSEELVKVSGGGDIWDRIEKFLEFKENNVVDVQKAAEVHGKDWTEPTVKALGQKEVQVSSEFEEVFAGTMESAFKIVWLNPVTDPRGYSTAIVDVTKENGEKRLTWNISPLHMRAIREAAGDRDPMTLTWKRVTDHEKDVTTFAVIEA